MEALDGLHIVIKDIGLGVEDGIEEVGIAAEIWDKDFDGGVWVTVADGADGGGPDGCAAVFEVIASDGGDDGVAQLHFLDGHGDASGFAEVEFGGATGLDGAERAGAGAGIAEDHDGGGTAGPALAHIGALSALADGM